MTESARRSDALRTNTDPEEDQEWTGQWPRYNQLPEYMRSGAMRYVEEGIRPGRFLYAILCNDLVGAAREADSENIQILPVYTRWLYNDVPNNCWGSPQIVFNWIKKGGLQDEQEADHSHP